MPVAALVAAGQLALAAAAGLNILEFVEVRGSAPFAIATGASASLDDLSAFGHTLDAITGYARTLAGRGEAGLRFVDGVPSRVTPAGRSAIRVAVDANPFAVDRSAGAAAAIDILTAAPSRRLSASVTGLGSALAAGAGVTREAPLETSLDVSTGIRGLPLIAALRVSRMSVESERSTAAGELAPSSSIRSEQAVSIFYRSRGPVRRLEAAVTSGLARDRWVNPAAGGILSPGTQQTLAIRAAEHRARIAIRPSRTVVTAIVARQQDAIDLRSADGRDAARHIAGFLSEGTDARRISSTRSSWLGRATASAPNRSWIAGFDFAHTRATETRDPNPLGRWHFGSAGAYDGWLGGRESALHVRTPAPQTASASVTDAALFFETTHGGVTAGARFSRAVPGGIALLPRLSWQRRIRRFSLHAGAGLFRDASSAESRLTAFTNEQAISAGADAVLMYLPVVTTAAANFEPPRIVTARAGLAWHRTRVSAFVDHSWTRISRLPSLDRQLRDSGIVDIVHARNRARISATSVRLLAHGGGRHLVVNVLHQRAMDDGVPGGYEHGVWAPSAGLAPLSLTAAGTLPLPGNVRLTVTAIARNGAPTDIFAGTAPDLLGRFLDRGALDRNSGRGPAYASVDLSLQGAVRFLQLTLVAGNVFDTRNATAFGAIVRSPTFGRPLGLMPGRAISLSARLRK